MKTILKYLWQIAFVLLLVIFIIYKYNNAKQAGENIQSAVAENEIKNLVSQIDQHKANEKAYMAVQDSLLHANDVLNEQLTRQRAKVAQTAAKYETERSKVKELPADSAAGLFLDRADCPDPVLKYENDYLVPSEAITFYNVMAVDFDEQKEVNINLATENEIKTRQIYTLDAIIQNSNKRIDEFTRITEDQQKIIDRKDLQVKAEHKKYRQQRIKTILTSAGGIVLFGVAMAL